MEDNQPKEGICWECRNIDLDSILHPSTPSPDASPASLVSSVTTLGEYLYQVAWKSIRTNCDLCARIQAMSEVPSNATRKAFSQPQNDMELECFTERGNMADSYSRYLRLRLRVKMSATVFRDIVIVPDTVARRVRAEQPSLDHVTEGILECERRHSETCGRQVRLRLPSLKIIDCTCKQLCYITPGTAYACLSYVWGKPPAPDYDFAWNPKTLPKTIEDATNVALNLGIRYLWVDRYCIDQEDSGEKHHLIQNMDSIYQCAEITLVAASGNDPDEGIPGINGTYRPQQEIFTLSPSGKHAVAVANPVIELLYSTWNTRGWTYQELYLSRRLVIFTETQICFQCMEAHRQEGMRAHTREAANSAGRVLKDDEVAEFSVQSKALLSHGLPISSYPSFAYTQLMLYYQRQFSFREDIIKAIVGLLDAFDDSHASEGIRTHFYGLPIHKDLQERGTPSSNIFVVSLSWYVSARHDPVVPSGQPSRIFPSWTWASLKADHHQDDAGFLQFAMSVLYPCFLDDIRIWLTYRTGARIDVDDYVTTRKEAGDYTNFKPSFHMQAWTISCHVHETTISVDDDYSYQSISLLGFEKGEAHLDRPQRDEPGELSAIFLGAHRYLYGDAKASVLIAKRIRDSTYRRIGLFRAGGIKADKSDGTREFLAKLRPKGAWELRTIEMV